MGENGFVSWMMFMIVSDIDMEREEEEDKENETARWWRGGYCVFLVIVFPQIP